MARARSGKSKRQFIIESIEPRLLLSKTIYVDVNATGATHDGNSWSTAFTGLQQGLIAAASGDEVHVADGIYKPASEMERFWIDHNIIVKGGYAGAGSPDPDMRDIQNFETILSGDIGPVGVAVGNCVTVVEIFPGATVDFGGFTLTGATSRQVFCASANSVIRDCVFKGFAGSVATGLYLSGASLVINCTFKDNQGGGGATASSATFIGCQFVRNSSPYYGGGLYGGSPTVINCAFYGNSSNKGGGGYFGAASSRASFTNCVFVGNSCAAVNGPNITLTNCTLVSNSATGEQGASGASGTGMTVSNSILWRNESPYGLQVIQSANVSYSDVDGGRNGNGNFDAEPGFARDPNPGPDQIWTTADDDYGDLRISAASPLIDRGNNGGVPATVTTDADGNARFSDIVTTPDAGVGSAPIVDIGAYEAIPALAANCGGDYRVAQGRKIELTGFGSSTVAGTLLYEWEWSGDGLFDDATGNHVIYDSSGVPSGTVINVQLRVTDSLSRSTVATTTLSVAPAIVYVDWRATGVGDGSSWQNAFTDLSPTLSAALPYQTIRVGAGSYLPETRWRPISCATSLSSAATPAATGSWTSMISRFSP
jgi:hypothetical protein